MRGNEPTDMYYQGTTVPKEAIMQYLHNLQQAKRSQSPIGDTLLKLENSNRIPSKDKFRMMPCKTFIMCGACPYHERCVFLHDPRIPATTAKARPIRSQKPEQTVKDSFFWPDVSIV